MKPNAIKSIQSVVWSPTGFSSKLLNALGVPHGFIGTANRDSIESLNPHHVRQVHGVDIQKGIDATRFSEENRPQADAIWSVHPEKIAVKTADCLPILIASQDGSVVAAVHAGWRGLTSGILSQMLSHLTRIKPGMDWTLAVGPAISRESFEVGIEVVEALHKTECGLSEQLASLCISKGCVDRWHVDLPLAAILQGLSLGLAPSHMEVIQSCTLKDKNQGQFIWNSYRRDGAGCPSNWSWIQARSSMNVLNDGSITQEPASKT